MATYGPRVSLVSRFLPHVRESWRSSLNSNRERERLVFLLYVLCRWEDTRDWRLNEVEGFFCQVRKKLSIRGCSHFYHKHCQSQYTIDEYRRYRLSSAKNTTFLRNQCLFDIHNKYIIFRTWCLLGLDVVNQSKPFPNILIGWAKLLCEVNQKKNQLFFLQP